MSRHARHAKPSRSAQAVRTARKVAQPVTLAGALAFATAASPHHALPVKVQLDAATSAPHAEVSPVYAVRVQSHPARYTIKRGQYLSLIAQEQCGNASDWKGIWHASQGISNPNVVEAGQVVTLACNDSGPGWNPPPPRARALVRSSPSSSGKVWGKSYGYPNLCGDGDGDGWDVNCQTRQESSGRPVHRAEVASVAASVISTSGFGGFQQCVITRESGGRTQVMNSSGHYGLYQFDLPTWEDGGGSAATFGHASVGEQNRVFASVYAKRGVSPWRPYDGC